MPHRPNNSYGQVRFKPIQKRRTCIWPCGGSGSFVNAISPQRKQEHLTSRYYQTYYLHMLLYQQMKKSEKRTSIPLKETGHVSVRFFLSVYLFIYIFVLSVILFICTTLRIFNHPRHTGDELVEIRQSVNHPVNGIVMQKVPIPAWESIQSIESLVRSIQQQNSHLDPYRHHPHHITPHHTAPHHTTPHHTTYALSCDYICSGIDSVRSK